MIDTDREGKSNPLWDSYNDPPVGAVRVRITRAMFERMRADLSRSHPTALERIGFLSVSVGTGEAGELLVLAADYRPIPDDQYVDGRDAGGRIGSEAIRGAMQSILDQRRGVFHVHMHEHAGLPTFSSMDRTEQPKLVASFRMVGRDLPHGMLLLSKDQVNTWVWLPGQTEPLTPEMIAIVGYPMRLVSPTSELPKDWSNRRLPAKPLASIKGTSTRFSRQSFLGARSQELIERARVAVVGLGGGGSHVVQQLAHVGFKHYRLFDGDIVDETNLNRLVGAISTDVTARTAKTEVARRVIDGLLSGADVVTHFGRWQERPELLRAADIVVACVDTFAERLELEVACRRYLMPLVDIGMDVNQVGDEPPRMGGQLILSCPDSRCFFCVGFLTEKRLAQEAAQYGAVGERPQVVWPNGVLASSAVGIVIDLVTGWTGQQNREVYLSFDGNLGTLIPHVRLRFLRDTTCEHFLPAGVGDPVFRPISQ